jgi:DNA-directed RNA polymerase subunit alpha
MDLLIQRYTSAAKVLIHHFMLFSTKELRLMRSQTESYDEESHMRQLLKTKLVDMDLSVRALNCLKEVDTLGDLVSFNKMT